MRFAWGSWLGVVGATTMAASTFTPQLVEQSIRSKGARQTIDDLERRGEWDALTNAIDKGASAWIALAPLLAQGSDAGSAEDLGLSLAFALPKSPRAVLTALDPRDGHILGAHRVCGRPFIEDTEPRGYKNEAVLALSSIHDPKLSVRKRACLKALFAAA